jgi:hypothetical protein
VRSKDRNLNKIVETVNNGNCFNNMLKFYAQNSGREKFITSNALNEVDLLDIF